MSNAGMSKNSKSNRKGFKYGRKGQTMGKKPTFRAGKSYKVKPEVFPRILYSRMKFTDDLQLTIAGSTATAYTYRMNSIYDPRYNTGGASCCGWAAMNGLYGNYQVMGAKVQLSFSNPSKDGVRVGCRLRINGDNPISTGALQVISAQPMTYISGINNTGSQKKNFNLYVKPWSLCGVSQQEYKSNISLYSSVMASNPSAYAWLDIFALNPWDVTSQTIEVLVKIIYYVKFFNRVALA